jgi:predicted DNA-binding transcriptional regulator AlpA
MQDMLQDDQRLIGVKEARAFLNNMPTTTFYRNIKNGIIPKARYMGRTPLWRLSDIRSLYEQLPEASLFDAKVRRSSR